MRLNKWRKDDQIVELCISGMTARGVASATGVPRSTVQYILHRLRVEMRHHAVTYHAPESRLTPSVALILGLHAGDGWVSGHEWGLRFTRRDVGMVESASALIRDVLGVKPVVSLPGDRSVMLRSMRPQVAGFFLSYGFPRGRKSHVAAVPQAILESKDREILTSFLKGVFSSDGCFSHSRRRASCMLSVSSTALRDGFVELAAACGFDFHKYSYVHKGGHNKVPLQVASISKRNEVERWMEQIGSMSDAHTIRYAEWRKELGLGNAFDR
ncbi:MAG: LAGLIDADG family homing endonuclease [Nitrososphaerales archaeon]